MPTHMEQPDSTHSSPASMNTRSSPSSSARRFTGEEPGATSPGTGASTLAVSNIDGYLTGQMTKATFDTNGKLAITYSNGQTTKEQTLALAEFASTDVLQQGAGTSYITSDTSSVRLGTANGGTSSINAASLEGSNVDLSKEFSAIIITQRGYQAASELISTANEMLDTLMRMKG